MWHFCAVTSIFLIKGRWGDGKVTANKGRGDNDCGCTVIVKSDGLIAEQVAQILEIAMTNSGLPASKIKVVEK